MPLPTTTPQPCPETREGFVQFASPALIRRYADPVEIVRATTVAEVLPALERIDVLAAAGLHAAGYVSYEASPAFDPAFETCPAEPSPLVWFGIYETCAEGFPEEPAAFASVAQAWEPGINRTDYDCALRKIREWLAAGDTYQVNFTFPMTAAFSADPFATFQALNRAQPADYAAYLDTGRHNILSASPELFFRLDGDDIVTKPMKGTARRGLSYDDDVRNAEHLIQSAKERAENLMIVDLLRNDLGRICETGSIQVERLFEPEAYRTLWQMTSTIAAKTHASIPEIFSALFPSGSVTGAPKIRTMQIIQELEQQARGVYCGAIGWIAPGRHAQFNVAIRTMTVDTQSKRAIYPVGSGVTWDSGPAAEYDECLLKADVLTHSLPDFELLESLLWDGDYFLLEEHLQRLSNSATYFGMPLDLAEVRQRLRQSAGEPGPNPRKVRLVVTMQGASRVSIEPALPLRPQTVGLAASPIDSDDVFLYHKTTRRGVYAAALCGRPELDDVLLWNERGEITESTRANVVVALDGRRITPSVSCGLLAGVMRNHLLGAGEIEEGVVTKDDLARAESIWLINSVRRWIDVRLVDTAVA